MIRIPVFQNQSADFAMNIDLDTTTTNIRLVFNTRSETWFMRLETPNSTLTNLKLIKNFPLLDKHKALFPELPGDFLVLQISNEIQDPDLDYDSLGLYWALFYLTEEELEAWRVENGL